MFNYHGYSGPCPKPPLSRPTKEDREASLLSTIKELMEALEKAHKFVWEESNNNPVANGELTEADTLELELFNTLSRAKSLMEQMP